MKKLLDTAKTRLAALPAGSLAGLAVTVAAAAVLAVMALKWAAQPSFEMLYSGLDARSSASVQSALAGANIRFRASQPPGPFVVHVDEEQYYAAQNAVALAGALDRAPEGISSATGAASEVFRSAQERAQSAL